MIIIKSNGYNGQIVSPTMFPDGTSQVWKLDLESMGSNVTIVWYFEQEAELIWINQLIALMYQSKKVVDELYIPYLPYGRQDKEISNMTTFAKIIFLEILLKEHVGKVTSLDAHSYHESVQSYSPNTYIEKAIGEFKPDCLVFPDKGAYERYSKDYKEFSCIVLDKVRDQLTGNITGMQIDSNLSDVIGSDEYYKLLIIDDICDGGKTFETASILLHSKFDCDVGLFVTHGIFSKGFNRLIESGISNFYTTQSRPDMINGYLLTEV